ncbi:2-hydroxyacid dehydrogenase [Telmatospirillum sp. J64-1]|uniref:2-hydroxyacid dehydrogenase n=1 Tax=Telmatospirillum sp. J64-1 TaxID=2502183 RepID=UPI00115F4577|nr:2-hydroxyacid dehydrogenase [Telmatospirillum sp. J64-1]
MTYQERQKTAEDGAVTDRPPVLLFQRIAEPGMLLLEKHFHVHHLWSSDDPDGLLQQCAPDIRAVLTGAQRGISTPLIDRLPKLEIVSIHGVGLDKIDLDHARRRGLRITNTPYVLTEDVADMALALMLAVFRRVAEGDRFVRQGSWQAGQVLPLGRRMSGKRLGILGMGRIGGAAAARAAAFGMEIAYTNRRRREDSLYRYEPSLLALAEWADVLLIAASAEAGAPPLVDARILDALGPEGFLINVGRGALVDETALVAALQDGRIAGAGLDVFVNEPHPAEALLTLDNVVLAPHQASSTSETRAAMAEEAVGNLIDHFAGRSPARVVV